MGMQKLINIAVVLCGLLGFQVIAENPQTPSDLLAYLDVEKTSRAPLSLEPKAKIAIIIDDIGYSKTLAQAALDLPGQVTYALIPHTPVAEWFANQAHARNREIMLHAPMSHIHEDTLHASLLNNGLSESEFIVRLTDALDSLPHIRGLNNHMGSQLTQESEPMGWLMRVLNQRGLFFIDSRTTPKSIAWETAQQYQVPTLQRDIFLDHERDPEFIAAQFHRLLKRAKQKEYAIAIAHPYPETLHFLQHALPKLAEQNIELVPASKAISLFGVTLEYP